MSEFPPPLVPTDVDLRDFKFMPLEVSRLRRSKAWLIAKRNPEIGFYMINLWAASWHEVPAGSLDDDDDVLADAAMCDQKRWERVKGETLRGWIKCSDGRLYHPVVVEKVMDAWERKCAQRARTEAARRARQQRRDSSVTDIVTTSVTDNATDNVTSSKGQGQGQLSTIANAMARPSGNGVSHGVSLADPPDQDFKAAVFQNGLAWLGKHTGRPIDKLRPLIGGWLKANGQDYENLYRIFQRASDNAIADPIPWVTAAVKQENTRPTNGGWL